MIDPVTMLNEIARLERRIREDNDRMNMVIQRSGVITDQADEMARRIVEGTTPKPETLQKVFGMVNNTLMSVVVVRVATVIDDLERRENGWSREAIESQRQWWEAKKTADTLQVALGDLAAAVLREREAAISGQMALDAAAYRAIAAHEEARERYVKKMDGTLDEVHRLAAEEDAAVARARGEL